MEALVWSVLYDRAVDAFGERPSGETEDRVLTVFRQRPEMVSQSLERTIRRFQEGAIYSPWIIWAKNVEEAAAGSVHGGVTAGGEQAREKQIAKARRWLRNVGVHFDRSHEVYEEMFERGPLRDYARDEDLVSMILTEWAALRPAGERVEREAVAALAKAGAYWKEVRGKKRPI